MSIYIDLILLSKSFFIVISVILQILSVTSALLSLSWLAVTYKVLLDGDDGPLDPPRPFTILGQIVEMLWNVLVISCRIIALSLFGSQYRYWFAAVIVVQCLFWTVCIVYIERRYISDWKDIFIFRLAQGLGYTFNITVTSITPATVKDESFIVTYPWYVFYWFITMLVNTILISIWFTATAETQLWYRIPATVYVIVGYLVSLFVKTFQTNIRKHNQESFDWEWKC